MLEQIIIHQKQLRACTKCPDMIPPVITGTIVDSPIMMIGQAPGIHEAKVKRPFGWTAGKKLFTWYESIGVSEDIFRQQVYIAAVCRCFPGKNPKGSGDRVPNKEEIANCKLWMEKEFALLKPKLIIPIGKLAINQFLSAKKLSDVVGQQFVIDSPLLQADCIPLPHPSGLSTWYHTEPGKSLLKDALKLLSEHNTWKELQTINNKCIQLSPNNS